MPKGVLELSLQGNIRKQTQQLQDTFLNTLGWKGVRKLEQFALVTAARAVQDEVRMDAPGGRNSRMGKSIRGRRSRLYNPGAIVGPVAGKKAAWFAWFVVRGTRPHMIPDDTVGRRVAMVFNGKVIPRVKHPGARANDFVQPSVERNIKQVEDGIGATIAMLMRDEAKRNHVVGLEVMYRNKTAAAWQAEPWARDYKNPNKVKPVSLGSSGRSNPARAAGRMSPIPTVGKRK